MLAKYIRFYGSKVVHVIDGTIAFNGQEREKALCDPGLFACGLETKYEKKPEEIRLCKRCVKLLGSNEIRNP